MTITRVGTNQKYAEGWEKIFAKGRSKSAGSKSAAKPSPKKSGSKASPKKAGKKK